MRSVLNVTYVRVTTSGDLTNGRNNIGLRIIYTLTLSGEIPTSNYMGANKKYKK